MKSTIVGLGCAALAVALLVFSITTSIGDNVQGKVLPVGLALGLLLAAVVILGRSKSRL